MTVKKLSSGRKAALTRDRNRRNAEREAAIAEGDSALEKMKADGVNITYDHPQYLIGSQAVSHRAVRLLKDRQLVIQCDDDREQLRVSSPDEYAERDRIASAKAKNNKEKWTAYWLQRIQSEGATALYEFKSWSNCGSFSDEFRG